jgi:hypothetical protein
MVRPSVALTRSRTRYRCANDTRDAYPTVLGDVRALVVKSLSKLKYEHEHAPTNGEL